MKSGRNDAKRYISFGVPDFETSQKNRSVFKGFFAKLTGANTSHHRNGNSKVRITNTTHNPDNSVSELNEESNISLPVLRENTSEKISGVSSSAHSPGLSERRYWMQDESCKFCFECGSRFTTIRRKHHCRVCGRIFCNQCSNQLVEGTQIGLDGLQRACSYCAEVLISNNSKKPENLLSKHTVRSLNADNVYGLKRNMSSTDQKLKTTLSDSISTNVSHLSNQNIRMNNSLATVSNAKGLLNSTLRFRRQTVDSFIPRYSVSTNSTDEGTDLFPAYVSTTFTSGSLTHGLSSPPESTEERKHHTMGSSAFHVIHRTPCKKKNLILDNSIDTSVDNVSFNKLSSAHSFECLLSSTSTSIFDSDQEVYLLWLKLWANSSQNSSVPITATSKLSTVSTESYGLVHRHSNENLTKDDSSSKLLQLFKLKKETEEFYCVYGLVLVYWLVNNIPELKRCRMKGRIVCQKFMDLGLLTDLQDFNCKEFHDDFTFYKLKEIDSLSRSYHAISPRRKTTNSICFDNDLLRVNSSTYGSTTGIDEPDWLLEINGHDNKSSGSSTPFLMEGFTDGESKPSTVPYNDSTTSNFEVGQDVSRMRDYNLEGSESPKKWRYISQLTSAIRQESNAATQLDGITRISKQEYIYNIKSIVDEYIYQLVLQDVRDNALDPYWVPVLIRLAWDVCHTVRFDLRSTGMRYFQFNRQQQQKQAHSTSNEAAANNNAVQNSPANSNLSRKQNSYSPMDIRYYVHIKKLLDKDMNNSNIFSGTIFSQRPTHKLMPTVLNNPRILLLDSSISYQRTTSKMAWLESQIMQEEEYITNCVCKILCLHPNIIFVSGTVCHIAQNFIFKSGIILFSNVKQSVLYRIARMTGADILDSVDRLMGNPARKSDNNLQKSSTRLGVCHHFEVKQIHLPDNSTKFLTFIENNSGESGIAPNPSETNTPTSPIRYITHEATVILRGHDIASVIRAKRCFLFALRLCYNAQLELSYSNNDHNFHLSNVSISQGIQSSKNRVQSLQKACVRYSNDDPSVSSPVLRKTALTLPSSVLNANSTINDQIIGAQCNESDAGACSDLAIYLNGRLLSVSPSVEFRLPYLASREGELAYLYAYYTYVVDWSFGRRLNDLMKRKLKVVCSELKAFEYHRINAKANNHSLEDSKHTELYHPFTKRNLEISASNEHHTSKSALYNSYFSDEDIKNTFALDGIIISKTLTSSDEALYTDYKARAYMNCVEKNNGEVSRSFPRLWAGIGSILSGHWDTLFNAEKFKSLKSKFFGLSTQTAGFSANSGVQLSSESEGIKRLRRSILDPRSYQSLSFLALLFTPKCIMRPEPCVPPIIATVEFYGQSDLPLGLFLEKFCFMQQQCRNPLCNVPMSEHIQRFIQTSGSVQLTISKLTQDPSRSDALGDPPNLCSNNDSKSRPKSRILMWLFCPICRMNSATRYMSADTWHLSFVKFLDIMINSSNDWARCGMIGKNSTYSRSTSGNELDLVETQKPSSPSTVGSGVVNGQNMESMLDFSCTHSVHKCLQHCFSFDRKLAVFKYQPVNVYEIVMPPSEIRVFPAKINIPKLDSNNNNNSSVTHTRQSSVENKSVINDSTFCNRTESADVTNQSHNVSNRLVQESKIGTAASTTTTSTTNLRKSVALPTYLFTEASEVLTKYYTIHTVIKCHIANLQNETISCELSAMLEAYLKVLESDSSRILMDERSEFLNFLLYPDDGYQHDERPLKKQDNHTSDISQPVDGSSKSHVSANENNCGTIMNFTDQQSAISDVNQIDSALTSDLNGKIVSSSQSEQQAIRNHSNSISSDNNSSGETTGMHNVTQNGIQYHDWMRVASNLNPVELTYIVQRLVNELKRWIYRFVSDWNFRFNEYELLMKRIEKNIRDTRKKGTSSNASTTHTTSVNQLSAIHHSTPIQIAVTTTTPTTPAKEAMTTTLQTTSAKTLSNANSMNSLSDTAKLSVSLQEGSSQCLDRSDEHLSSSSMTSGISFQKSVHSLAVDQSETRILANSSNNIPTVTQTPLDDHPLTTSLLEVNQTTKNDNKSYKYIKSTSKLNSFKASLYTFGDNSQHVTLHNESKSNAADDNIAVDSSKHLSILDTINMKAVYQRNDPEISGSTLTHQNHHQSNKAESTTDHHIRPTISSQTNPSTSGVRRFIHTFLSSAMDLKVFGEPVPANEHPQLIVCDESCITILKQFYISQSLSNESTSKGSDCSRPPASVCQLLLANPDIYVNDREFTSIIAFALTTSEYERKLVDLHSTLQVSTQLTSDVQLGQSALANFKEIEDESAAIRTDISDLGNIDEHEKANVILDNEVPVVNPGDYESSVKSDIHQEVNNSKAPTSSHLTTPRDQKLSGLTSSHSPNLPTGAHHSASSTSLGNDKSNVSRSRHIKIQFSDSSTNFFCCIYYASEFFRLRQLVMPNGDMTFIQSLSRCYHWDARGGKSGSLFMKTRDERFVIKELSSIEMKTFHEISQEYFDYLITAALDQRLCVLSRILGIFHVGFKNSASGEAHRFDVLVMENLFHGRTHLAYIYDLKGSLRKRLADESSNNITLSTNTATCNTDPAQEMDETVSNSAISSSGLAFSTKDNGLPSEIDKKHIPVLLDQNLLNASIDNPLYLRVHSKNALAHCLNTDTTFLANLFIMDYSLLVGVDTTSNQLVVGLIDYLRKFTLDKRLEMIIKQTITSAQGPMPTILTPDLYRERFLYQLHSYFPLLPDQWYDSLAEHTEGWRVRTRRKAVGKKQ